MDKKGEDKTDDLISALRSESTPINFDNIEYMLTGKSQEELQEGPLSLFAELAYIKWVLNRNPKFAPFDEMWRELFDESIEQLKKAKIAEAFHSMQKIGLHMGFVLGLEGSSVPVDKLIEYLEKDGNRKTGFARKQRAYNVLRNGVLEFADTKWKEDTEERIRTGDMKKLVKDNIEKIKNDIYTKNFTNIPGDEKKFWDTFKDLPLPVPDTLDRWIDESDIKPEYATKPGAPKTR